MRKPKTIASRERQFERGALRAAFVSLFAFALERRKRREDYKMQSLADGLQIDKSAVSRWFSGTYPNWQIDTIADIADELGIEIQISARERATGEIITPHGVADVPETRKFPETSVPVSIGPSVLLFVNNAKPPSSPVPAQIA